MWMQLILKVGAECKKSRPQSTIHFGLLATITFETQCTMFPTDTSAYLRAFRLLQLSSNCFQLARMPMWVVADHHSRSIRLTLVSRLKRSSYYESDYRQSAALIRARRPYLFKNMATGAAIFSFALGVCACAPTIHFKDKVLIVPTDAFTIHAVGQDNFEDVKVPDAPLQPAKTPNVAVNGTTS
jgi:cytochrome c oxidase assembly factor 3, fungi type